MMQVCKGFKRHFAGWGNKGLSNLPQDFCWPDIMGQGGGHLQGSPESLLPTGHCSNDGSRCDGASLRGCPSLAMETHPDVSMGTHITVQPGQVPGPE